MEDESQRSVGSNSSSTTNIFRRVTKQTSFQSGLKDNDFVMLLRVFSGSSKRSRSEMFEIYQKQCLLQFSLDYETTIVPNADLCSHYPAELVIPHAEKSTHPSFRPTSSALSAVLKDVSLLRYLFSGARAARCRERFAIPVFVFNGKVICRSATLSSLYEAIGREVMKTISHVSGSSASVNPPTAAAPTATPEDNGWMAADKRPRVVDVELLKRLNIHHIFDLMVEDKKVKYNMFWSSSEKVDEYDQYLDFNISKVPYPGCEYFREVADNGNNPEGMFFNWKQPQNNTQCALSFESQLGINWHDHDTWDLVQLTQNYFLAMVESLMDDTTGGLLVHCISGWDRTPLFTALLRLSLWADGVIHQTLDVENILFLTIAYDWLLFGHQFSTRLQRGETIFFFCFNFLKYLEDEKFSVFTAQAAWAKHNRSAADPASEPGAFSAATSTGSTSTGSSDSSSSRALSPDLDAAAAGAGAAPGTTLAGPTPERARSESGDSSEEYATASQTAAAEPSDWEMLGSHNPLVEGEAEQGNPDIPTSRQGRLSAVRTLFLSVYEKAEREGAFATGSSSWSLGSVVSSVRSLFPQTASTSTA